jgi:predicted acetyltransferase
MTPDVRPIRDEELVAYLDAASTGFLERFDTQKLADEVRLHWELARTWAAWDGGRVCGTFRSWGTEITLPGGAQVPAAAVSGVTVLPTHRRRGVLRSMVAAEHAAIRERGEAVGLLYASEYPIYGRFGYGPGTDVAKWTLDALATTFRGEPKGRMELAPVNEATRDAMRSVHDAWRRRQPGEIGRRDFIWDHDLGLVETAWGQRWKGFVALHRDASGTVDGYARYHAESKWEQRQPRNEVIVDELHAIDLDAYAALWRFLAEIDWVSTIRAENRPPDERLRWLLMNARAAVVSELGDGIWVRLFDVPKALEARTYERAGRVVLELIDAEVSGGRQRVELEGGPDGARCQPTDRSPDLTIPVGALGAVWLGGRRLQDVVLGTGVDEHRHGALAEADVLFRTAAEPWCSTFF